MGYKNYQTTKPPPRAHAAHGSAGQAARRDKQNSGNRLEYKKFQRVP